MLDQRHCFAMFAGSFGCFDDVTSCEVIVYSEADLDELFEVVTSLAFVTLGEDVAGRRCCLAGARPDVDGVDRGGSDPSDDKHQFDVSRTKSTNLST